MLLYVYVLRERGRRRTADDMRRHLHVRCEVTYEPWEHLRWGRPVMLARAMRPGSTEDAYPMMEDVRIRIRHRVLLSGMQVYFRATKSRGERSKQTWLCSAEPVRPEEWPRPPPAHPNFEDLDDDEPLLDDSDFHSTD